MSTLLVADIGGTTVKVGFIVDGIAQSYFRLFSTSSLRNTLIDFSRLARNRREFSNVPKILFYLSFLTDVHPAGLR